ncbi:MAG: HpaII family restriction endonuclease [Christensenellaceae bacterium]|jgi:hypothetical protein|nr:HpaII family restriction endonuclease [Christensenellaceae bacterium]
MLKGNKGEWSEIYVFFKLLGDGRIYAADDRLKQIEKLYFPIVKIIREEETGTQYEYVIADSGRIKLMHDGNCIANFAAMEFADQARELFKSIAKVSKNSAFSVENIEKFMFDIKCQKIKAPPPSTENGRHSKIDITMQIHDPNTNLELVRGFSIKSELGEPPTLLNASNATNFIYEVQGLSDDEIATINAIGTKSKIKDRMHAIRTKSNVFSFYKVADETFEANLEIVDSRLAELLSYAIVHYYIDGVTRCTDIVELLIKDNPLDILNPHSYYSTKFKKFLASVALGMIPATPWDGCDEASGGYIIVTRSGKVLSYHIRNRDNFEEYLLQSTRFEKASSGRHKFASLYKTCDKTLIKLNMQIRFMR